MKKWIFVFLVFCLLWDLQRIPGKAAETGELHTVAGDVVKVDSNCIYWDDGENIYYFYGVGYHTGEKITNVLDTDGVHVFIDVKGV